MNTSLGNWLSVIAILGMALPIQAAELATPTVTDVALSSSGSFRGAVVSDAGKPLADTSVQVIHNQTIVAQVKTDSAGRYSIEGLRSGLHMVQTTNHRQTCRFWNASTAPPAAKQGLVLTTQSTVVRGQCCDDGCGEGCGENCGFRGACGGCLSGSLLPIAAFGAVTAVTLVTATRGSSSPAGGATPPASP